MSCQTCKGTGYEVRPSCEMCSSTQQAGCPDVVCRLNDAPLTCRQGCPVPKPPTRLRIFLFKLSLYLQANAPWVLIVLDKCLEPFGIELGFH